MFAADCNYFIVGTAFAAFIRLMRRIYKKRVVSIAKFKTSYFIELPHSEEGVDP